MDECEEQPTDNVVPLEFVQARLDSMDWWIIPLLTRGSKELVETIAEAFCVKQEALDDLEMVNMEVFIHGHDEVTLHMVMLPKKHMPAKELESLRTKSADAQPAPNANSIIRTRDVPYDLDLWLAKNLIWWRSGKPDGTYGKMPSMS